MAKSKKHTNPQEEMSHIRHDLESLRQNIMALTRALGDEVADTATSQWSTAKKNSRKVLDNVENEVRTHPAQSVMTAFSVGLILSLLMSRR